MKASEAKIAIYGAGAMGSVLGALLTKGGLKNVDLITRNKAHAEGMKKKGATIICEAENTRFNVAVNALTPEEIKEKYDVVFLMTKQKNNEDVLEFLFPYLADNAVVCTTQNGLPEEGIARVIGKERTYGAVASFGATFLGNGETALTSKFAGMSVSVGGYGNDERKTDLLLEILSLAGKAVENENFAKRAENLAGARWSKLAINSAFSGLSVVTGLPFGVIAKKRKTRKLALGILRECMDVATANGVALGKMQGHDMQKMLGGKGFLKRQIALFLLPIAMRKHKKLYSGMLKDIQKGRKCEIDYINGVVGKIGREVGVDTPLCDKVVEIAHGIENGLYEIAYDNVKFF